MKYTDIKQIITAHFAAGDSKTVHAVSGSPGCGKSALGAEIGAELGFDRVVDLNLSMLEIPDVAGLYFPDKDSSALRFYASPAIEQLQTGRNLVLLDEFADSQIQMQNVGRRMFWTREINGIKVSPETHFILLSNRSTDKSGAGKLSGKVKNAVSQYSMESNLEDWVQWALGANIDPVLIQFLRFKPAELDAYNPDHDASPTPRQWEMVNYVPTTLPQYLFFEGVKSKVGEGAAVAYTAFRKIYQSLVSFEDVVMNPTTVKIPTDLSAQYAIVGSVAHNTTAATIERVALFVERMPSDFSTMFWNDSVKKTPALKTTKAFIKWATASGNVLLN
jgi:hypothetical protein